MNAWPTDTEAQRQLVASYAPRVFGLMLRMVAHRETAEDLTQEALMKAVGALARYRPEGKFEAWLFRIAANTARDWIRRRGRQPTLGLDPADPAPPEAAVDHGGPADPLTARERHKAVREALAALPAPDREVLSLRYYGELSFKEIAATTGEPLGTVLARAHRALKKLAALMPPEDA